MNDEFIKTFDDLSIDNKRNLIFNLLVKMDMLLNNITDADQIHREISGYVYKKEDEDEYLTELYKNMYNLTENLIDYLYFLDNKTDI